MKLTNWQKNLPPLALSYASWMGLEGSLTQALQGTGQDFSVRVLDFSLRAATDDEAACLATVAGQQLLCRQVVLCLNAQAVVYAASLCDAQNDFWRSILDRGGQSLGLTLFDKKNPMLRTDLEFSMIAVPDPRAVAAQVFFPEMCEFPARRARFFPKNSQNSSKYLTNSVNSQLLVQELFLPNLSQFGSAK